MVRLIDLKYNDLFFVHKSPKKKYTRNVKIPYLLKWIRNNNFEIFTLDMFFKVFPKQRKNRCLNKNIFNLIDKKIITQIGKTKFRVNGGG